MYTGPTHHSYPKQNPNPTSSSDQHSYNAHPPLYSYSNPLSDSPIGSQTQYAPPPIYAYTQAPQASSTYSQSHYAPQVTTDSNMMFDPQIKQALTCYPLFVPELEATSNIYCDHFTHTQLSELLVSYRTHTHMMMSQIDELTKICSSLESDHINWQNAQVLLSQQIQHIQKITSEKRSLQQANSQINARHTQAIVKIRQLEAEITQLKKDQRGTKRSYQSFQQEPISESGINSLLEAAEIMSSKNYLPGVESIYPKSEWLLTIQKKQAQIPPASSTIAEKNKETTSQFTPTIKERI